ncbi:unnamed protein product [Rotaria sp. Silwood2]|nr:unnamed protein product [Rotaria sp. Silwood2]CAF2860114.1 unnamed protein product [Rotaria sp. Silwood2]CAF3006409.1 unnamed protein product [Rotaria sp. Silwood2]CAF3207667.1 unnamed protein product [Rotaria sp. Silwood2]CAF3879956.1 unnamed protein product [Rotaria sp. Silwood2]
MMVMWQYMEKLYHQKMKLIEKMNLSDFQNYLRSTYNTIWGRYPISLLLAIIEQSKNIISANILPKCFIQYVKYDQSNQTKQVEQ